MKHLAHAGLSPDDSFEMLLVGHEEAWHIATPLLPFGRPPVGARDWAPTLLIGDCVL